VAAEIVSHSGYDWLHARYRAFAERRAEFLAQLQASQSGTRPHRAAGLERHGADQSAISTSAPQTLLLPFVQDAREAKRAVE